MLAMVNTFEELELVVKAAGVDYELGHNTNKWYIFQYGDVMTIRI